MYSNEKTANGEYAHRNALTAAHKTLPFGTYVRGHQHPERPHRDRAHQRPRAVHQGRIIDLTPAGAKALGFDGLAPVTLSVTTGVGALRLASRG